MINAKITNDDRQIAYAQFEEDDLYHRFIEGASFLDEDQVGNIVRVSRIPTEDFLIVDEAMLDATDDPVDFAEEVLEGIDHLWD